MKRDDLKEMLDDVHKTMADCRRSMGHLKSEITKTSKDVAKQIEEVRNMLHSYSEILSESTRMNQSVDETLGSVLLAIKQNEYLQTYYPKQHGFEAGKYTGQHPSKLMKGDNNDRS